MSNKPVSTKIDEILNPDFGKQEALTEDDKAFIDEYNTATENLDEELGLLAFKNVIRQSGRCGFAQGGTVDYLINTDTNNRYRVTIRTYWRSGINSGQSDRVVITQAGGRLTLGCTDSGYIPVTYYSRQVVGESKF